MEQPGEFVPGTRRAGHCDFEDLADSLHRLPPTLEDFQIIIPCRNWTVLFQGGFCITLHAHEILRGAEWAQRLFTYLNTYLDMPHFTYMASGRNVARGPTAVNGPCGT